MGPVHFTDDFKRDAVAQISERGYPVAEVSKRLGVSQ
jgi:transposase